MKTSQADYFESHRARHAFLVHAPEIAGRTALAAQIAAYGVQLDTVERLRAAQARYLPADHARRDAIFHEMTHAALVISGIVSSYAAEHAVPGLRDQVRLVPSDFALARFADRVDLARQLHEAVTPLVAELAAHDLTPEVMADLQTKIEAAEIALPTLRWFVVGKQAATAGLAEALRRVGEIERERILPLLIPLQKSAPDFYRRYRLTREVRSRRRTRATQDAGEAETQRDVEETTEAESTAAEDVKQAA